MLKIRRSHDCLIFNMGIPIPGKEDLYIETGPWCSLLQYIPGVLYCSTFLVFLFAVYSSVAELQPEGYSCRAAMCLAVWDGPSWQWAPLTLPAGGTPLPGRAPCQLRPVPQCAHSVWHGTARWGSLSNKQPPHSPGPVYSLACLHPPDWVPLPAAIHVWPQ